MIARYARWLHTRWPAGTVDRLPVVREDGSTNVRGIYVTGDLTGIPLLKFASDTGARAVETIVADPAFERQRQTKPDGVRDLIIVGAGVSGMAAALAARTAGLDFAVHESKRRFQTIADFPARKPIFTYPTEMQPAGELQFRADVKEDLLEELERQSQEIPVEEGEVLAVRRRGGLLEVELADGGRPLALRAIVAVGRSGKFRRLGVPGEDSDKVYNRIHDPGDFAGRRVLVVGGGDSAVETALAVAQCGGNVTLSYRNAELVRPKPENLEMLKRIAADSAAEVSVERPVAERVTTATGDFLEGARRPGSVELRLETTVEEIRPDEVVLRRKSGETLTLPNEVVFAMIGGEPPLGFFRRSGVRLLGEWGWRRTGALIAFFLFCVALYNWKSGGYLATLNREAGWFPFILADAVANLAPGSALRILGISAAGPAFWYTLAYSSIVAIFGYRRIRRRRTPYVTVQTLTLIAVQVLPLFLLPELILPWLDAHGWLPAALADSLFPQVDYGHGREFWRAYGLILAWPLNVYNLFTPEPLPAWIAISILQTLVLIPLGIYFWGKGFYCGWICSCGALAETLGDTQRHKMPHGPFWNRLNMAGQFVLLIAVALLGLRIVGWVAPDGNAIDRLFDPVFKDPYKWWIDVFLAGAVGYGLYFWFSGRVWCRFFCPLAALMHIYARFSRFRIFADKKKCISCNVCTSVCHQGIDVMNFANKGLPMADPECVRCSACVGACPTGVLSFGRIERDGNTVHEDRLAASPVRLREAAAGSENGPIVAA